VEFLALTLWDSLQTIKRFTGADPDVAIVEPEGMAALTGFDHFTKHYEVIHNRLTSNGFETNLESGAGICASGVHVLCCANVQSL
jgi:hypothetical protein